LKVTVNRGPSTDEGTFSKASIGILVFDWLELPDRGNQHNISRIPEGVYTATLVFSPHFNMQVFQLLDVPNRTGVEIHPANWAGDVVKGYYSDLEGCSAPGYGVQLLETPHGPMQMGVANSRNAFRDFMAAAGTENLTVEILPYTPPPDGAAT
jgi:hypothetical protein